MNIDAALELAVPLVFDAEGCKLTAYLDTLAKVPVWTIGFGSTWANGRPVAYGMTCSRGEAVHWASEDMRVAAMQILSAIQVPLADHQLAALVSLTYNIGIGHFRQSGILRALNAGFPALAADRFLDYDHAGGVALSGLRTRRERERAMFLTGYAAASARPPATVDNADESADALNRAELDRNTAAT